MAQEVWIDAQLSPAIADWLKASFPVKAVALRELGLRDATDREIFAQAKQANAIVMTKDSDFVQLLAAYGPPPQIIWLTCGNTSNVHLKQLLSRSFTQALSLPGTGEALVEISVL